MKTMKIFYSTILLLAAALLCPHILHAQPSTPISPVPPVEAVQFHLIITGTRYFADADSILGSLKNSKAMQRLVPSLVTQNRQEYDGTFLGSTQSLTYDIQSLSMDRFEMNYKDDPKKGLVITLHKLQ